MADRKKPDLAVTQDGITKPVRTMHEGTEFDPATPTTPAPMHGGTEFDPATPTTPAPVHGGTEFDPATPAPMHGGTELGPPPPTTPTIDEPTLVRKIPRGGG